MTATSYRLARGVRLRRDGENVTLLVPEGIVTLNASAGAALEAIAAGAGSLDDVTARLRERFDDPSGTLEGETRELLEALAARGFLER